MKRRWLIFVAFMIATLALDQGSKAWARGLPVPAGCHVPGDLIAFRCGGVPQPVIDGYWDWELAFNPGAAFSSFIGGDVARILLMLIAAGAVIAIAIAAWRTSPEQRLKRVGYAMIAGGALGNWLGEAVLHRTSEQRFRLILQIVLTLLSLRLLWGAASQIVWA